MLQDPPKQKGVGKNRKGHPKTRMVKVSQPKTKSVGKNELKNPLPKTTMKIMYQRY